MAARVRQVLGRRRRGEDLVPAAEADPASGGAACVVLEERHAGRPQHLVGDQLHLLRRLIAWSLRPIMLAAKARKS
jgi:hypothetical protein